MQGEPDMLSVDVNKPSSRAIRSKWLSAELLLQDKPGMLSKDVERTFNRASHQKWSPWYRLAASKPCGECRRDDIGGEGQEAVPLQDRVFHTKSGQKPPLLDTEPLSQNSARDSLQHHEKYKKMWLGTWETGWSGGHVLSWNDPHPAITDDHDVVLRWCWRNS